MSGRTRHDAGTGTQYYTEACVNWEDHPRISEKVKENYSYYPEQNLAATQYRSNGRTWQCGGEYWDPETNELWELVAVVRKSSWCSTKDAENAPLYLQFSSDGLGEMEIQLCRQDYDLNDRFQPRHNIPFDLPP